MKSILQYIALWFIGAFALMHTLSWFSGQPQLPFSVVLFADGLAMLLVLAITTGITLVAALFTDD